MYIALNFKAIFGYQGAKISRQTMLIQQTTNIYVQRLNEVDFSTLYSFHFL